MVHDTFGGRDPRLKTTALEEHNVMKMFRAKNLQIKKRMVHVVDLS